MSGSEPDAWDADDFEPEDAGEQKVAAAAKTDRWDGEDEDDELKDNWDDDEAEKKEAKSSAPGEGEAFQVKKKVPLKERLAKKEAQKKAELEAQRLKEAEERKGMTPEELVADKLRRRKLQEEADLKLAKEAFGITDDPESGIDACAPITKDEFETFGKLLKEKITAYKSSTHYVPFLESLFRDLTIELEPDDIKKLGSTLNTLCNEKVKAQKGKTKKKKQGAKLMVSKNTTEDLESYGDYGDEFEDFI